MKVFLTLMVFLTSFFIFATAFGDGDKRSAWQAERARLSNIYRSRPQRIDEPLRAENVSDDEIREIQAATVQVYPGAIANVSGVTAGCPCEEGPSCDSQVWILAYRDSRYQGLMLSNIDSKWSVGPIQEWWLNYDRLAARIRAVMAAKKPGYREAYGKLREEQVRLQEIFPACLPVRSVELVSNNALHLHSSHDTLLASATSAP